MPVIQFRRHAKQVQVEDFPKGCERTVEGAMYVRPGATAVVTDAELKHLEKCKIPLLVVSKDTPSKPASDVTPEEPPQGGAQDVGGEDMGEAPTEPPEVLGEAPEGSGKGKKRDRKRS